MRLPTISDYLSAFRRRKLLIAFPALALLAASVIAIKRIPNVYEASTFIIVESPAQGENTSETAHLDLQRRLTTIREQVTSRSRLDALIRKHDLYKDLTAVSSRNDRAIAHMVELNRQGQGAASQTAEGRELRSLEMERNG
jgi:uncharacterized protein involved in exopolysaccharide biosynthesis